MDSREKKYIKLKFALTLVMIIKENKIKAIANKAVGIKDHKLINSLRKLEASSGISFPIIQKISKADKNPALSTIVALADGLNLRTSELFSYYDKITEEDINSEIDKRKKKKR